MEQHPTSQQKKLNAVNKMSAIFQDGNGTEFKLTPLT
jgi:hypothetical protein